MPGSPADGDEVYYQVYVNGHISGNTGYWHLRYNSSTTYWDFLGGTSLRDVGAGGSTSSSTFQTSGTPYAYLPLNGDYDITFGDGATQNSYSGFNKMEVALYQNTTATDYGYFYASSLFDTSSIARSYRLTGITGAGGTSKYVQTEYRSLSSQSSSFGNLFVNVTPVRVK